jgi:GMP synthase (glutamine-hydrolysing)
MVFIIDFGSQYSQLIARRVRALGVEAALIPYTTPLSRLRRAEAIILSGGPASVYTSGAPHLDRRIFGLGVPVLGICYGMQLMAHLLGGRVERSATPEYGPATLLVRRSNRLFGGVGRRTRVWMSHGDLVVGLPRGFVTLGLTEHSPDAAIADDRHRLYGVQFHPEVEHTAEGQRILENFVCRVAGCRKTWDVRDLVARKVSEVAAQVENGHVVAGVSGGVDSTVAAAIVSRAVGTRLTAVFVDHGLLRQGEPEEVRRILTHLGCRVRCLNARRQFLTALRGVTYGERKRKIIGAEFIRTFRRAVQGLAPRPRFLAQGTIHSDVIESARAESGQAARVIKSHHNVGGLPKDLTWQLVEPLRDLFKDQVRELGEALGLPKSLVWRQPFPGPGLAIRIAGEVTEEKLKILRQADAIVREEIERAGRALEFYHYFAQLLSLKTVGVTGDGRTYAYPVVVRVVTSSDIMTADWARLPHEFLSRLSWRITTEVKGAARVLYDITPKPPATTEWE